MKFPLLQIYCPLGKSSSKEHGFTLIELLVVIVILTALAAIAMPTMLSQANKARQTEAKRFVSSMCKGQQVYYLENNQFASMVPLLNLGMKEETENYQYSIIINQPDYVLNLARAKEDNLKSYTCVNYLEPIISPDFQVKAGTFLCEADLSETDTINVLDSTQCPEKFTLATK